MLCFTLHAAIISRRPCKSGLAHDHATGSPYCIVSDSTFDARCCHPHSANDGVLGTARALPDCWHSCLWHRRTLVPLLGDAADMRPGQVLLELVRGGAHRHSTQLGCGQADQTGEEINEQGKRKAAWNCSKAYSEHRLAHGNTWHGTRATMSAASLTQP